MILNSFEVKILKKLKIKKYFQIKINIKRKDISLVWKIDVNIFFSFGFEETPLSEKRILWVQVSE